MFPNEEGLLREVSDHVLSTKGKKFRPTLLLLTADVTGDASENECITAAVVVELVHMATLIHDDAIDKSPTRRGKPTVHSRWNEEISIIMGDYIYSKAFRLLAGSKMFGAMEILARSTNDMTIGEMSQIEIKGDFEVTEDDYLTLIDNKTASLIAAACEIGAMAGGSHEGEARTCSSFGRHVGLAFQIMDDILDFVGEEEVLGKPRGSDIKGGDITLPLIAALRNAPEKDRCTLRELASSLKSTAEVTGVDFDNLVRLIDMHGGFTYARDRAAQCARAAKGHLLHFENSPSRDALLSAAAYVVRRDY
jgi:octaprenyl-diphosphate synthase